MDAAERRKQLIQESKFLGGDMEHTHLVKGLDYALLQKVRKKLCISEVTKPIPNRDNMLCLLRSEVSWMQLVKKVKR